MASSGGVLPRRILGRPPSFWRAAAAAGLASGSLALQLTGRPGMDLASAAPLLLAALAVLAAGPALLLEREPWLSQVARGLLAAAFAWPVLSLFGGVAFDREAALFALPGWMLLFPLVVLSWRLRQQDPELPGYAVAGGLLLAAVLAGGPPAVPFGFWVWAVVALAWIAGVRVAHGPLVRQQQNSAAFLGGLSWFVLLVVALTVQEWAWPTKELLHWDEMAAAEAQRARLWLGWGLDGFSGAAAEFSQRDPALGDWAATAVQRLVADAGLPVLVLAVVSALAFGRRTVSGRAWPVGRTMSTGAAGLWVAALIAGRMDYGLAMWPLALLLPGVLGEPEKPSHLPNEDWIPPRSWSWYGSAAAAAVVVAFLFPAARAHYERQQPAELMGASTFLAAWAQPHRDATWLAKKRWEDIATYTDPVSLAEEEIDAWIAIAPRDEFAHSNAVDVAVFAGDLDRALERAQAAHGLLPWSDVAAMQVLRVRLLRGELPEAEAFLLALRARRGGQLSPLFAQRLAELRGATPPR